MLGIGKLPNSSRCVALGPLLYLLYVADVTPTTGTEMATFADDTTITQAANPKKLLRIVCSKQ